VQDGGTPGGHLVDHRPGDLDLGPRGVLHGDLAHARPPVVSILAHDLEDDGRVRGRAGRPALDG
jgi:hypothetical protein